MNPKAYFEAAMQIINLANNIVNLMHHGAEPQIAKSHFDSISRIAAEQAAKPEIQGYSEHE